MLTHKHTYTHTHTHTHKYAHTTSFMEQIISNAYVKTNSNTNSTKLHLEAKTSIH